MIRAMDLGVEQIYKAAQEITDRETIIIFGSDNGATVMALKAMVSRTFIPTGIKRTTIARSLGNPDDRNLWAWRL